MNASGTAGHYFSVEGNMLDSLALPGLQLRPMTQMVPRSDLIVRAQSGDVAAFRLLYQQHHRQVLQQLNYLVGRAELEDVLQDVFIQVFKSLPRFQGKSSFSTWLYRLTVHVAMKTRRKRDRSAIDSVEEVPEHADEQHISADSLVLSRQRYAQVEALLQKLAPKKRAVLVMHDLQGMDAAAIAEVLEINVLTVRTRLFYARREVESMAQKDARFAGMFGDEP